MPVTRPVDVVVDGWETGTRGWEAKEFGLLLVQNGMVSQVVAGVC